MKKTMILAIAFVLLICCTLSAQTKTNNSLLWEISGNGLQEPSYLFGTFHIMCEKDFEIKPKVSHALDNAKTLFLELNFSDQNELMAMQKMVQTDKKLSDQLNKDQLARLSQALSSYNLTFEQVDNFSIQALYSLITQKAITCPPTSLKLLDVEIMKLALAEGKSVKGLETVEEQLHLLGNAYNLDETIDQLAKGDEYASLFEEMIHLYKEENLPELDKLLKDPNFMNDNQEQWLLTKRNINWAEKMPIQMAKESTFFAVGAGHLSGKNGVIQLLENKGYKLRPVLK